MDYVGNVVPMEDRMERKEAFSFSIPELGYQGVKERIYSPDHPEVISRVQFFTERFKNLRIFERFEEQNPERSKEKSVVVSAQWHRFSEVGPWFDCQAAARVTHNRIRHYIVQVAFEELGMRDEKEIHHDLFWQAARLTGATNKDLIRLSKDVLVTEALQFLKRVILSASSDSQILGLMLGLEIPARENIETVFNSLAHSTGIEKSLAETKFFKIHRQIEIEHIRLSVANFLRFCRTKKEREQFVQGCDQGLTFWDLFWTGVNEGIRAEKGIPRA